MSESTAVAVPVADAATKPGPVAVRPVREVRVVESEIATLDTAKFEQMQRIAQVMAQASLLPDHLQAKPYWFPKKGHPAPAEITQMREKLGQDAFAESYRSAANRTMANCFLVVNQAFRWGLDPFSIMGETYEVGGKLGYQGKLVAAVLNFRAGLEKRLEYEFSGDGDGRTVTVRGRFKGEAEDRTITLSVAQAKTDNQMWKKDPDQKLIYSGVVKWARRHAPEVVLGVMTDDDLERMAAERSTPIAASQLDAFAGGGQGGPVASLEAPAEAGQGGEERLADRDDDAKNESGDKPPGDEPALLTPERIASIRELAKNAGVPEDRITGELDGIASDLCGCELAKLPASFDTAVVRELQKIAKAKTRK